MAATTGTFDPYNAQSWYFGPMTRQGAEELLQQEEIGVFLVRNSTTSQGDLVLCVREDDKVSHYIIQKIQQLQAEETRFRIGDQIFPDIPALLHYYMNTLLDTTSLKRPIDRPQQVKALYDFAGRDEDDLPFRKGDVLTVLAKDEDQWWTAKNKAGQMGSIPVPYVSLLGPDPGSGASPADATGENGATAPPTLTPCARPLPPGLKRNTMPVAQQEPLHLSTSRLSQPHSADSFSGRTPHLEQRLPAKARVIQEKVPNAYDKTALRLHVGDVITVTKANINGQWEGELNGKSGHFPFTHVALLDPEQES